MKKKVCRETTRFYLCCIETPVNKRKSKQNKNLQNPLRTRAKNKRGARNILKMWLSARFSDCPHARAACLCVGRLLAKPTPGKSDILPSTDYFSVRISFIAWAYIVIDL